MKLNNHGWGLNQMLIYCGILFFFLLVAIFFIIQLSNSLGDALKGSLSDNVSYATVEENVKNSAVLYMNEYYKNEIGTGTITVTVDNLLKYKMLEESDLIPSDEKTSCKGYALVKKENSSIIVTPYISCLNYETNGYQSWRLGD